MATPTSYQANAYAYLAAAITATQNTGITFMPVSINGATLVWAVTGPQILKFTRVTQTKLQIEYMYLPSVTVSATTGLVTSGGTTARNISTTDPTSVADNSPGIAFSSGTLVEMIWSEQAAGSVPFKDVANTFTNDNTIATTKKWYFGDTGNYIKGTSSGDITFHSNTTADTTLAQLAAGGGTDHKAVVSATDTTAGYLLAKIPNPTNGGIILTQTGGGGDETLVPSINLDSNPGLVIASNAIKAKVKANSGLTLDTDGLSIAAQTSAGYVLTDNGASTAPTFQALKSYVKPVVSTGTDSATLTNPTTATSFSNAAYTIPANDLVNGVMYRFSGTFTIVYGTAGNFLIGVSIDTSYYATMASTAMPNGIYQFEGYIMGTEAAGGTANVKWKILVTSGENTASIYPMGRVSNAAVATNGNVAFAMQCYFGSSNASNTAILNTFMLERVSTTAF
jgi:hypothetical protein